MISRHHGLVANTLLLDLRDVSLPVCRVLNGLIPYHRSLMGSVYEATRLPETFIAFVSLFGKISRSFNIRNQSQSYTLSLKLNHAHIVAMINLIFIFSIMERNFF